MACLYKRKQTYWISYYVEGKLVQKSLRTSNEKIAVSKQRQIEYELALGDLHAASKLPLPAILQAFCQHLVATRTHKSCKNDLSRLRVFFGPVCEALEPGIPGSRGRKRKPTRRSDKFAGRHVRAQLLEDITPQMINRFIAARVEHDGWTAKSANLMRQVLQGLFNYAIKHHGFRGRDRRYPNPGVAVERRREPARHIRFLELQEIDRQLQILQDYPVIHAMVATYIYAGLRREEGVWLTRQDIALDRRLIRVRAKTPGGEFWQPKTRRDRVVPISSILFDILSSYEPPAKCAWFFPSPTGKRWDPDNFSQDLRRINGAHGLDWSCAVFRHTFGSQLAQKGESLYKISALMGNSPEICRKHYAALIPEKMSDVVEFDQSGQSGKDNDGTRRMLEEILRELKGSEGPERKVPYLRLVKPINSA